jgi:hypothetical protein
MRSNTTQTACCSRQRRSADVATPPSTRAPVHDRAGGRLHSPCQQRLSDERFGDQGIAALSAGRTIALAKRRRPDRRPATTPRWPRTSAAQMQTAAVTKAEASDRLGYGRPRLLLPVGDPPERQSVAGFCAGDNAAVGATWRGPGSWLTRPPVRIGLAETPWARPEDLPEVPALAEIRARAHLAERPQRNDIFETLFASGAIRFSPPARNDWPTIRSAPKQRIYGPGHAVCEACSWNTSE